MTPEERALTAARRLREVYGTPRFAGGGRDPLDCLIETVLSQKTTTPSCRLAFGRLKAACGGDWGRLPCMPLGEIEAAIRPAGLARSKAHRLAAVVARVIGDSGAASLRHLRDLDDGAAERYLETLPGVGPKTAKCVLLFALGREVLPVDTHVGRLGRRLGLVGHSLSDRRTHALLAALVPPAERYAFHLNGFRHGREVCLALWPRCNSCCLNNICPEGGAGAGGTSARRGGDGDSGGKGRIGATPRARMTAAVGAPTDPPQRPPTCTFLS